MWCYKVVFSAFSDQSSSSYIDLLPPQITGRLRVFGKGWCYFPITAVWRQLRDNKSGFYVPSPQRFIYYLLLRGYRVTEVQRIHWVGRELNTSIKYQCSWKEILYSPLHGQISPSGLLPHRFGQITECSAFHTDRTRTLRPPRHSVRANRVLPGPP